MPAGAPFVHSFMLGDVLVANDVVETASSKGDAPGWPFDGIMGLSSGECTGGEDGLGEGPFGLSFGLSLLSLL